MANHTGELGSTLSSHNGWIRLPDNATIFRNISDPSAGPTSGHIELIFSVRYRLSRIFVTLTLCDKNGFNSFTGLPFPGGHFFTILPEVVSPTSRKLSWHSDYFDY